MADDSFVDVTEVIGEEMSGEQHERLCHRYIWAGGFCGGRDVLEVACGSGPGLPHLASVARSLAAGDVSAALLETARRHHGGLVDLRRFDAEDMPYPDGSFDVVLICEALYYVRSAARFVAEARRVLRPGGTLLVVNSNKDLFDFNPSPHSTVYHGVAELGALLEAGGFRPAFWGYLRADETPLRQRLLRPAKRIAVALGLMPRTMRSKTFLKRLVFGRMTRMPAAISPDMIAYAPPDPIPAGVADRHHKIIYCAAVAA